VTGWVLYVLLFYFHVVLLRNPGGFNLIELLFVGTESNYLLRIFMLFIPMFFYLALLRLFYRAVFEKASTILRLTIVILSGSIIGALLSYLTMELAINLVRGRAILQLFSFRGEVLFIQFWTALVFVIWSGLYFGIKYWQEWSEQGDLTEKLYAQGQQVQLQMLRYQLNPHFLFNALNSIRALIGENKQVAKQTVTELSEFLRYSLLEENYAEAPLSREIEAIRHYGAIEKRRFGDNLELAYEISPEAGNYPIISFLVHPLVENAVKYGLRTSGSFLKIRIVAGIENEKLHVGVYNTGQWVEESEYPRRSVPGTRTGLKNVRARLDNAYPQRHTFWIVKGVDEVSVHFIISKNGVS